MAKRFFLLVGASAVISVLLLMIGAFILNRINAFASSQAEALVLSRASLAEETLAGADPANQQPADQAGVGPETAVDAISGVASSARSATVAELVSSPGDFYKQTVTLNGRVTLLNDGEFLLNDGTGQILVDLEDDDVRLLGLKDGDVVIVTGILETDDGYLDVDACEVITVLGAITLNDCSKSGDNSNGNGNDGSGNSNTGASNSNDVSGNANDGGTNTNDSGGSNSNDDDSGNSNDDDSSNSNDDDSGNSNDDDSGNSNDDDNDNDNDNDNDGGGDDNDNDD
jgi:uncharacterized protein YdeI (BOF family)